MAKQLFVIAVGFLLSSLWLINSQLFDCYQGNIKVAFVYDCRYSLQLQQDFFSQFIQVFDPLKHIASDNKGSGAKTDVNLILMTYTETKLMIFERLTQENFTLVNFNETALNLNTSSCPQHLPLKTVFNDTREALGGYSGSVRKLAIFLLAENLTDDENGYATLRHLETEQGLNVDVKRLFILIKTRKGLKEKGLYSLYTNTFNNLLKLVKRSIGMICNSCNKEYQSNRHGTSCYNVRQVYNEKTAREADEICDQTWPGSHLVYLNSQSELGYVTSVKEIIPKDFYKTKSHRIGRRGVVGPDFLLFKKKRKRRSHSKGTRHLEDFGLTGSQFPRKNPYEINMISFIGLSSRQRNNSEGYTWNDGTPLVVDAPWGSRSEGQGCVYMSLKFSEIDGVRKRENLQWNELDCDKPKLTDFVVCESDMIDVNRLLLNVKEFAPKKEKSYFYLLYTSYSQLLFNHINNELEKNNVMSLMKRKLCYRVIQKQFISNGKLSEDSRKNGSSTNITQIDVFLQIKQRQNHTCKIKIVDNDSVLFNDDNDTHGGVRYNEQNSTLLNESRFDVRYFKAPHKTVQKCMYEKDSDIRRVGFANNTHLKHCKQFLCPPGFVKCPESYCIPVYLVNDSDKDCPHGEDEESINYESRLCKGKLLFTLRNICLHQDIWNAKCQNIHHTNDFVCQVPCDTGYVCVSNIVRKETGNDITFYVSFVETVVEMYDDLGLFTFTPQIYSLFQFFKLVEVDLSNCKIIDLVNLIESLDTSDVIILDVSRNSISGHKNLSVIQEMKYLQKLNMSFNKHLKLDENFIFPLPLQVLDMSDTRGGSTMIKYLVNLTHLKVLELRNVEPIDLSVTGNVQLDILDVRGTQLMNIKDGYLNWLSIQTALYTDNFRICCQVIRGPNIHEDKCHAPRDAISTCNDLIGDPQKRVILWVVGILSLLGNMVVVIYRISWDRAVFKKAYGIFVVCLGVSDFIMGIYLIIIAGADLIYRNIYVLEDYNWRYSGTCKFAGILSTFSSETSTMFICLITLDRYLVIKYPFGQHRFSKTGKITSLFLTLIIGVVVSVIPVLFPDWEIYSSNGMCLALPFSSGRHKGWEYSAILFVGINFFLFILITIGQLATFIAITSYNNSLLSTRDAVRKAQDRAVAKQLFLVALSDFCCWFPIGIMGIMSLSGFQFNLDVYAWSAVLVLPINSAINPLIYTMPVILKTIKTYRFISKLTSRSS